MKLAVLGDPLRYTRSPDLHRAGCAAVGVACESVALRTPVGELPATLDRLAREGYTGCNLTMPLKTAALPCMTTLSAASLGARSVNTVTFLPAGHDGDTTDGDGFLDLLIALGREPGQARVVLLGSGGAARSLAWSLGAPSGRWPHVVSRRAPLEDEAWRQLSLPRWSAWGSSDARAALALADVVVNGTPLECPLGAAELRELSRGALVVDLNYREGLTPWVLEARARGLEAVDGLGLLVHQARRSLVRWLGREVPLEPLLAAVRRET